MVGNGAGDDKAGHKAMVLTGGGKMVGSSVYQLKVMTEVVWASKDLR